MTLAKNIFRLRKSMPIFPLRTENIFLISIKNYWMLYNLLSTYFFDKIRLFSAWKHDFGEFLISYFDIYMQYFDICNINILRWEAILCWKTLQNVHIFDIFKNKFSFWKLYNHISTSHRKYFFLFLLEPIDYYIIY